MNGKAWKYADAPGGLQTAGWYVAEWKKGLAVCKAGGKVNVSGYGGQGLDLAGFRAFMLRALERRIAAKVGPEPAWRKLDYDYQTRVMRDCRAIRDKVQRRVRVYQLETKELRARYAGILDSRWED